MARDFDGANDNLSVTNAILTNEPITMACWFNHDLAAADFLMHIHDGTKNSGFALQTTSGSLLRIEKDASGGVNTTAGFTDGVWAHACGIFASNTSRTVYLNGANSASNTADVADDAPTAFRIGEDGAGGSDLAALVAEAAIWNVALTAAEVAILAKGIHPFWVQPAALVAYWPLWGRNSPEPDYVGGFNLTVTGATQAAHPPRAQMLWLPTSRGVFVSAAAGLAGHGLLLSHKRNRLVQMAA